MTKPSQTALSVICIAMAITGCSNNTYSQPHSIPTPMTTVDARQQLQVSESEAAIIRQLPSDADIENMDEQRRLVLQHLYLTWDGHRRDLDAKPSAQALTAQKTGHLDEQVRSARNRASTSQDAILLDKLPPPIVIE